MADTKPALTAVQDARARRRELDAAVAKAQHDAGGAGKPESPAARQKRIDADRRAAQERAQAVQDAQEREAERLAAPFGDETADERAKRLKADRDAIQDRDKAVAAAIAEENARLRGEA